VVKSEAFPHAGTLDVCEKVGREVVCLFNLAFPHPSDNLFQAFLLECPIARIQRCQDFFDKIIEAIDVDCGPLRNSFNGRDNLFNGNLGNAIFLCGIWTDLASFARPIMQVSLLKPWAKR